jgi:deoxyhypusine synthase
MKNKENAENLKEIKHIKIKENMKVSELINEMSNSGFGAGKIAMVPAGMKQIIIDLLEHTNIFVTTGANLTHDLIEALGYAHYQGKEIINRLNDEELNKKGLDRIYNVLMPNNVYEKLEDFFEEYFSEFQKASNIKEFLWKIGEVLSEKYPDSKSILKKCYENQIPLFCPGIADSGIGLMMWGRKSKSPEKNFTNIDVFSDMNEIIDIAWTSKKSGVIYIGGGLPKNFIQQSLQFSKGADYGIQITTDRAEPGGSSGAPLKEGISWGKMNPQADFVDVFCDATIALPLIYASIKE